MRFDQVFKRTHVSYRLKPGLDLLLKFYINIDIDKAREGNKF